MLRSERQSLVVAEFCATTVALIALSSRPSQLSCDSGSTGDWRDLLVGLILVAGEQLGC